MRPCTPVHSMGIFGTYYPHMAYTSAPRAADGPTLAQLIEMSKPQRVKAPLPFTVVCENKEVFMETRTPRERLCILNAYATIKENPMLGTLGMEPGLYTVPGMPRIYYHIITPPEGREP